MSAIYKCDVCGKTVPGFFKGTKACYKPSGWHTYLDKYQGLRHACGKDCGRKLKEKGMERI